MVAATHNSSPTHSAEEAQPNRDLEVLRVAPWAALDWLAHGFSTRRGGVSRSLVAERPDGELNLGYTANDLPEAVAENRRRLIRAVEPSAAESLVTIRQMHSSLSRRVTKADAGFPAAMWGDGLLTDEPGVLLGIQTADCLPILIADRKRRAVGAFHAGWRGTLKGIVEKGVASMREEFGSCPEDLIAAIGPGIGSCCFEVGSEMRKLFGSRFAYAEELFSSGDGLHLDLIEANRRQLLDAGLLPESIHAMRECTSCKTDRFFSYRAERGKTGRMMSVIGIKSA